MVIGKYKIQTVTSGSLWLDGGAIFGIVPKTLWSKIHIPDERNRIQCITRCLLIQGNNRTILVDTGSGDKWDEKQKKIYSIEHHLLESLEEMNVKAEDITDVVLTHLHFDHAGGATREVDGTIVPTFPKATYYVQRTQWEWAVHPSEKDRGSYRSQDFLPLMAHNQLVLLDGESELSEGISLIVVNGHTIGQQLLKVTDGSTTVVFCGDFLPYAALLPYPYIMAYDLFPHTPLEEKKRLLKQAEEEQWILVLEHDPTGEAMTIRSTAKGFELATFCSV